MASKGVSLKFTVHHCQDESGADGKPKTFTAKLGSDKPVRIGRAPGNDIEVKSRGVSQYHAELRLTQPEGSDAPKLCVRDLSMNGSGLKRAGSKQAPMHLQKRLDTAVGNGDVILVPMMLKVSQDTTDRAWLKIEYDGEILKAAVAEVSSDEDAKAKDDKDESEDEKDKPDTEVLEANRMKFVELLLKTREVSSGTTYAQAKKLLSHSKDWDAVDEATRKECFDIFVAHLGQQGADKKKKDKKGKEKEGGKEKKSKKHKEDSVATPEPKVAEAKKRRKSSPSPAHSSDRKRKRDRKQRSRSRPARSVSGERAKRRRRSP